MPNKAKSAATMVCLGASKVYMGTSSELGPIDPQISLVEGGVPKRFSVHNLVQSYTDLFERAVGDKTGNLQPYLQQLANYDEREIQEYRAEIDLSEDIAVRTLADGMMRGVSNIPDQIRMFLAPPERTKVHGRPIYRDDASGCGLSIESIGTQGKLWELLYELYLRTNNYVNNVSTGVSKSVETKDHAFYTNVPSY